MFAVGPKNPKSGETGEGTSKEMFFNYYSNDDSSDANTGIFREDTSDDKVFQPTQAPAANNPEGDGSRKRKWVDEIEISSDEDLEKSMIDVEAQVSLEMDSE